jgi:hypothetical protein
MFPSLSRFYETKESEKRRSLSRSDEAVSIQTQKNNLLGQPDIGTNDYLHRDKATNMIQRVYRTYRTRKAFRLLIRQHFIKIFSPDHEGYVYKNKVTGTTFLKKPVMLGDEELPIHRYFVAPSNYAPARRRGGEGFALLVTVTEFVNKKIPSLPEQLLNDSKDLADILTHDYFGRFVPENVMTLVNPKCSDFVQAIELFRKMVASKRDPFFVMYLCTHVVKAPKGEEHKPKTRREKDCYFLFADSVWKSPQSISSSAVSLVRMVELINSINMKRKTIILNYAHVSQPKKSMFGVTKLMYPPPDFLFRLTDSTGAAVLGCCTVGMSLESMVKHSQQALIGSPSKDSVTEADSNPRDGRHVSIQTDDPAADRAHELAAYFRREWRVKESMHIDTFQVPDQPKHSCHINSLTGGMEVTLPKEEEVSTLYYDTTGRLLMKYSCR